MFGLLRNLFSGFLSFVLVPTLVALLFLLATTSVLLNKEAFLSILRTNNTFQRIGQDIIPSLLVNLSHRENTEISIPSEVTVKLFKNLDKTQLSHDLETLVANGHDYVSGSTSTFNSRISVEPFVKSVTENLKPEIANYINSLPTCTAEEEQKLSSEEVKTLTCKPSDKTTEQLLEQLGINEITSELEKNSPNALVITETEIKTDPEIINLDSLDQKTKSNKSALQDLKAAFNNLRNSIGLLIGIALFLTILLFISRLPDLASSCKWLASALFSASIFPLAFGILVFVFAKPEMLRSVFNSMSGSQAGEELSKAAANLLGDVLASFAKAISQSLILYAFILIGSSIVVFIAHLLLQKKHKQSVNLGIDLKKQ